MVLTERFPRVRVDERPDHLKFMKFTKVFIACGLGAWAVSAGAVTTIGTYVFTATPGSADYTTAFDGSEITIGYYPFPYVGRVYTLEDWNLMDQDAPAGQQDLTPENSFVTTITPEESSGSTGWTGSFSVIGYFPTGGPSQTYEAFLGSSSSDGGPGFLDSINGELTQDPIGTWSFVKTVPDGGCSLGLLAGGLALMEVFRQRRKAW
jgi:hypothetical protein